MNILFINSKGFWLNGWLNTPAHLQNAIDVLKLADITVDQVEINDVVQLRQALSSMPPNTLVWPNAYYTRDEAGKLIWLQEVLDEMDIPFVGTAAEGLKRMLEKEQTHHYLSTAGVPVPPHICISRERLDQLDSLIETSELHWPVVVKPSAESCSMGVVKANNLKEAILAVNSIFEEFPYSSAMVEAFLPSEDITCGFLQLGDNILLLPTYYQSLKMPGAEYVVERDLGVAPWGGPDIVMPPVLHQEALTQLARYMPKLVKAIGIGGITRVDARMDVNGTLRFFDVNGMPALSYPKSVLVRQVRECFPAIEDRQAYQYLLYTVVMMAASRYELDLPSALIDQNLFNLSGGHVIRLLQSQLTYDAGMD